MTSGDVTGFYDGLAYDYHLIFADWDASIRWQAEVIGRLLAAHERPVRRVLDAACGIGTQALGLAAAAYDVTATDVSERSVERCAREAARRDLHVKTHVADLRRLDSDVAGPFDCAVAFDNALPHLLSDADLVAACQALRRVLAPGGLLCASIRDYDTILETRPTGELPRTTPTADGERVVFQVWEWTADRYTVRHFLLNGRDGAWEVAERRVIYRALRRRELTSALEHAGFTNVSWLMPKDTGFYQPVVTARSG